MSSNVSDSVPVLQDDVLVRSKTWGGESTSRKPKAEAQAENPTESDAKCYGGRFTYGQWRQFFAQKPEKGLKLDASGQVLQEGTDFSWNSSIASLVQFFRAEIWLLVLLHSDGASMASMASSCRAYQKIALPWRPRGSGVAKSFEMGMMGVSQLAARLRCGLHLAEELLDSNEISLPKQCCSWLDLLYKQEIQGADMG